jgi:hypothetical protein
MTACAWVKAKEYQLLQGSCWFSLINSLFLPKSCCFQVFATLKHSQSSSSWVNSLSCASFCYSKSRSTLDTYMIPVVASPCFNFRRFFSRYCWNSLNRLSVVCEDEFLATLRLTSLSLYLWRGQDLRFKVTKEWWHYAFWVGKRPYFENRSPHSQSYC